MKCSKNNLFFFNSTSTKINDLSEVTPVKSEIYRIESRSVEVYERIDDLGHYPLSFLEEYEIAHREIDVMTKEERIELGRSAFGIWEDDAWKYKNSIENEKIINAQTTGCTYRYAVSS